MVELVKFLVESLVDDKEAVVITQVEDTIKISVSRPDMGKIIGRQGKIAKAIRTVVKAAGIKSGKKCTVEILEVDDEFKKEESSQEENLFDEE